MTDERTKRNVELARGTYTAFGRGEIPAILAIMTDDVEMGIVGRKEDAPFLGMRKGKEGVLDFFQSLGAAQEIHMLEPLRFLGAEDKVFVWGHYRWTMRTSGVAKHSTWLHELTFRDGKLTAWQGHNDTAMLAAAYHAAPVAPSVTAS